MKNRDYFTRPIQSGGRSANDYGRTRITDDSIAGNDLWWWAGIALIIGYFVVRVAS